MKKVKREKSQATKKQPKPKPKEEPEILKGWTAIGAFLSLPPSTAQRWARDGMPVKREGRFTTANRAELQEWLGRESNMPAPAQVITAESDLAAALKQSIKAAKPR